jgi:butyrate kinase
MKKCLLINPGSSDIKSVKISTIQGLPDNAVVVPVNINLPEFPVGINYHEAAKLIVSVLETLMSDIDFILFRCPAFNFNVLDITLLTNDLAEDFSNKTIIQHGSELGFWLAYELIQIWKIPAIFSRGIPTSMLPEHAVITGHPKIRKSCLSHWEAVEGSSLYIASLGQNISEFILVMLGSGTGIYLWEKPGVISCFKIRQWDGPMSPSSVGGIDALALLDFEIERGETSLKEARKVINALTGSKGGFQLYNPRWLDLREFKKDLENGNALAKSLFEAWVIQITGKIGEVKLSMQHPKSRTPLYFFGGGANWTYLVERISERLSEHLFSELKVIEGDPENTFFVSQAVKFSKL